VAQKKVLPLSLCVNMIGYSVPIRTDASKSGINLKKLIHLTPTTILHMFLAERFSHKNEAVLCWV
jgi:hypothetical protein